MEEQHIPRERDGGPGTPPGGPPGTPLGGPAGTGTDPPRAGGDGPATPGDGRPWGPAGPPFLRGFRPWGDGPGSRRLPWPSTLLLTVFVVVGTVFAAREQHRTGLDVYAFLLLLAGPVLLLVRRTRPVVCVAGVVASVLVYFGAGYPYGPVFVTVAVACFSVIASGHRKAGWWAVGVFWAGHALLTHLLYRWLPPSGDHAAPWEQELVFAAWVVAVCAAGELARVRREQWARQGAERAAAEKRRRDGERLRIARELHDVLAHSISVINVQAGVGLAHLDSDPEQARTALTTIKAASKEALGEVRQVLDTLRTPGEAPRSPAPGLDRLPELVEQAGSAGLTVEVVREGEATALPPGADLAAFRIIQEALTNVVRHSGSRSARVSLRRAPELLELRIEDGGPATGGDAGGSGNGLVGMRERAAALGGTLEAGPRPDGGFRVRATLPFTPRETP